MMDASAAVAAGVPLELCLDSFHPLVRQELTLQRPDMALRLAETGRCLEFSSADQAEALALVVQPVLTTLVAAIVGAASILICLPALSVIDIP
jgi:hypothetical protein